MLVLKCIEISRVQVLGNVLIDFYSILKIKEILKYNKDINK